MSPFQCYTTTTMNNFPKQSGILAPPRLTLAMRAGGNSSGVQRPRLHPTRGLWTRGFLTHFTGKYGKCVCLQSSTVNAMGLHFEQYRGGWAMYIAIVTKKKITIIANWNQRLNQTDINRTRGNFSVAWKQTACETSIWKLLCSFLPKNFTRLSARPCGIGSRSHIWPTKIGTFCTRYD